MSIFYRHKRFFDSPVRLDDQDVNHPEAVLARFCEDYQLHEVRQQLWDLLETALTTENTSFSSASQRESAMLFYARVEELMEAVFIQSVHKSPNKIRSGRKKENRGRF